MRCASAKRASRWWKIRKRCRACRRPCWLPEDAPATSVDSAHRRTAEGAITLDQLIEKGQRKLAADPEAFERIRARFDDQALAVLYMTSGATGEPKMGLVTHAALVINIDMTPAVLPLTADDCTVAFLPSAHIAQRVVGELMPLRTGSSVWFSEGPLEASARTAHRAADLFSLAAASVGAHVLQHPGRNQEAPRSAAQNVLSGAGHGFARRAVTPQRPARPRLDALRAAASSTKSSSTKFASAWAGACAFPSPAPRR